jgi:hypothetical protein
LFAVLVASVAIALHSPGQISMDTSLELYEALVGRTISNQPPFMSALFRWLGGGEVATAELVLINSVATYLAFAGVIEAALKGRCAAGFRGTPYWKLVLCALIVLNPVVFVYVGIVWKDVLFGSALLSAVALSLLASASEGRQSWIYAICAAIVLALAARIRQQGVFVAPLLMAMPLIAVTVGRAWSRNRCLLIAASVVVAYAVIWAISGAIVSKTITESGNLSYSTGFSSIMQFDMAGIIFETKPSTEVLPVPVTAEQRNAVMASYSSARVDSQALNPVLNDWFNHMPPEEKYRNWSALIKAEPGAYLRHRLEVYECLLDIEDINGYLKLHVGVEGNSEYLHAVGISEQQGDRARLIYRIAARFFGLPIFRHWFYFLALLVGVVVLIALRMPVRFKSSAFALAFAAAIFYISYFPTGIASDFRYLYANVLLVSAFWLMLLCAGSRRDRLARAA